MLTCSGQSARAVVRTRAGTPGTRMWLATLVLVTAAWLVPADALALRQGTTNIGLGISTGRALGDTYTVLGVRLGYFVADGFELALAGEMWRGGDPDIYKFSPEVRYIWYHLQGVKPYVGAFYSRAIYDGLPDANTYGARGGVFVPISPNAGLAAGLVYERIQGCNAAIYQDCSEIYPELSFNVAF